MRTVAPPDSVTAARWTLTAAYYLDRPAGWVDVRENAIRGTRLSLERDLGVRVVSTAEVALTVPVADGALGVTVDGTTLQGSALLGDSIHFNGATLAGGTVLKTRTEPPDFLRIVVDYALPLLHVGRGGELLGRAGLDATLLNVRVLGTLSPTTVGHETKEDFVTQELPAPFLGATLRVPVGRRAVLRVSTDGGGLPWVSSLRYEGGLVALTQRRLDAQSGLDVGLLPRLTAGIALHYTSFIQYEQSHEDGNEFRMDSIGGTVRLSWDF
jgi:hypothetical protein